ncbi:MAG: hypothetical protein HN390_02795 [Anaerolineae bacterium]|jgi:hypothetical protein|nr:hypothetical protein [Anaerolineae bacterium]MBT7190730.1 hypothetical protein [Anaerolineae bacterium]MBT7989718.1 hypothetical protein [Anaerolineae bacterium]
MKTLKKTPFLYTFFFGIFPPLSLLAHNAREIPLFSGFRALVVVVLGIAFVYFCLLLILKNKNKTSLITSLGSSIFFFYGHLYSEFRVIDFFNSSLGRHRILAPVFLVILGVGIYLIIKKKKIEAETILSLNIISIILILIPLFQISQFQINRFLLKREREKERTQLAQINDAQLPDIYYIILDGYPRDDILASTFNYDNREFIYWLESQGFYVALCSQSNYSYTAPSIASTLNLTYLGSEKNPTKISYSEDELNAMLQQSLVQETVTELGYTTVTFETEYDWLKWHNPDVLFALETDISLKSIFFSQINPFEILLLDTSFASVILDRVDLDVQLKESIRQTHQAEIVYTLETLLQIPKAIKSPKFVYAHIVSPHPPFIFGAGGELLVNEPANSLNAYRDQIIYLNSQIQEFISIAFQESSVTPIIIIQGDHGAAIDYEKFDVDSREKLAILNAYYLPNFKNNSDLYPEISPVNSFRLIFNHYFLTDYEILDDRSIYGGESPYQQLPCAEDRLKQ